MLSPVSVCQVCFLWETYIFLNFFAAIKVTPFTSSPSKMTLTFLVGVKTFGGSSFVPFFSCMTTSPFHWKVLLFLLGRAYNLKFCACDHYRIRTRIPVFEFMDTISSFSAILFYLPCLWVPPLTSLCSRRSHNR